MLFSRVCALVALCGGASALRNSGAPRSPPPALKTQLERVSRQAATGVLALSLAGAPSIALAAASSESTAGFEEFAASGGVMKAEPSCFMNECGVQSKACFTNPSCLKGVTCLGNCRGEQLCATQCFARFGSEKLNDWLSCTLEENECVTTGAKQDTTSFYADPPQRLEDFDANLLSGKWVKVVGYSPKYDCFPCQFNTFSEFSGKSLKNDIEFRVPKPTTAGFWQNRFDEKMVVEKGPQGKASLTVEGKMYGLTFHEQWYVVSSSQKAAPYVFVAYKGDTQQGPYDGAFLLMRDAAAYDESPAFRADIDKIARRNGLDPSVACRIDNACPNEDVDAAGVSSLQNSQEKLTWKDVFELSEWVRPGTLSKQADFDPSKMR